MQDRGSKKRADRGISARPETTALGVGNVGRKPLERLALLLEGHDPARAIPDEGDRVADPVHERVDTRRSKRVLAIAEDGHQAVAVGHHEERGSFAVLVVALQLAQGRRRCQSRRHGKQRREQGSDAPAEAAERRGHAPNLTPPSAPGGMAQAISA
jgi:hypothetical protein